MIFSNESSSADDSRNQTSDTSAKIDFPRDFSRYATGRPKKYYKTPKFYFSDRHPRGICTINYNSELVDLLVEDQGFETTIVYFHAAVSDPSASYPIFSGINLSAQLEANAIHISDPALARGSGLSWFTGTETLDFQKELVKILKHALGTFDSHKHLVFFGASGGGFAAIYFSSLFKDSLAVSINPQTNILNYLPGAVKPFLELCWSKGVEDKLPFTYDLTDAYREPRGNTILYLQNLGDRPHVRQHLIPFLRSINSSFCDLVLVEGEWGLGHRAPGPHVIKPFLESAISSQGEWLSEMEASGYTMEESTGSVDERSTRYLIRLKKVSN